MYKVLIVEDDPMVAMINEKYVNKNDDFKVIGHCRNGQEALDFLEANPCDLVILDVYMPYMNGVETLKKIREKQLAVEVVMVTAANDTSTLEETMHLGVIDYLVKPFAYERFQIALEKFSMKISALKGSTVLNQNNIDSIISSAANGLAVSAGGRQSELSLPKGIQEKTLELILKELSNGPEWLAGDTIAEATGLSSVTVRRYMNYLVECGRVVENINYETGGRPSMLYRKK